MKEFGSFKTGIGATISLTAGATAGLASMAGAAVATTMHTAETTAKLYEQAQAAGVSTDALSVLSFAAKQNGVDQGALVKALGFLNKEIYAAATGAPAASKAFRDLGINVRDGNGQVKDAGAMFPELMNKFAGM